MNPILASVLSFAFGLIYWSVAGSRLSFIRGMALAVIAHLSFVCLDKALR